MVSTSSLWNGGPIELYHPPDLDIQSDLLEYFIVDHEDIVTDPVVMHESSNLARWLIDQKIGTNLYDPCAHQYLWSVPKYILDAIALFCRNGGYADMTVEEYVRGVIQ